MKSLNCDVSMNVVNEVDLTDLSMKETTDDELDEELENKEKVEKLKLFSEKLLYSEDEAEQIELALKLRNLKVMAEQVKISGAGFILKKMRLFTPGKPGEIIRKLYRRYKRALVMLEMSEDEDEEENWNEHNESFDDGKEDDG